MHAAEIMTTKVITVQPDSDVRDVAKKLLKHRISAVPVVDSDDAVVGIVSEGDLMRRAESGTAGRHSWWLEIVFAPDEKPRNYIKARGQKAADVMTKEVITVAANTPVDEIAHVLEKNHVKRVPVVHDGRLIGIVSRANLLQALATAGSPSKAPSPPDDAAIREKLLHTLGSEAGLETARINVTVDDGAVVLWGIVDSSLEKHAAQVAAETTPGVKSVENNLGELPPWAWAD